MSPTAVAAYNLILPAGTATGAYGAESCGSHTTGVYNGWDCDRNHWYKDANGVDTQPRSPYLGRDPAAPIAIPCPPSGNPGTASGTRGCVSIAAFPGSPYNLRDIDCYDDSNSVLRPLGVSEETIAGAVRSVTAPTNPPTQCAYPTP